LNGNKVTADGVKSICEHLGSAERQLPELNLARNEFGDAGAQEVAKLLKSNPTITKVNLSGCKIGNKGVAAIVDALGSEGNVLDLDLSHNEIGVEGALSVEKLIKQNSNISNVNLSHNKNLAGAQVAPLFKEGFNFQNLSLNRVH